MPTGSHILIALAAGLLVAAVAAVASPLLVFPVAAGLALAMAAWAARPRPSAPPAEPAPQVEQAEPEPLSTTALALIETLAIPLLIIAPSGRLVLANSAARESLPQLEIGMHYASLIRAPAFVDAVSAVLEGSDPQNIELTTHRDRERYLEAWVAPLPPEAGFGPERQAIVQIEDRTRARRGEQQRSDFIANASHELRTPLAAIIGYIETLQHHARDDAEARAKFLGIMAREAGRMQRLVDDLMSLSRIEMTEHLRPAEEWSLNQIAAESATTLLPLAAQEGIDLQIEITQRGAPVLGQRDQLAQVFTNLIDNAMKYAGPGATVRIHTAEPGRLHPGRYGISVTDTGPGIAREHLHRLTERFYRVSASVSRNKGGTGLGLAIVKHILNRHDGRLEISSTLGVGSTFTVWLPRSTGAKGGAAQPEPEPQTDDLRSSSVA